MKRAGAALTMAAIGLWSAGAFAQGRDFAGSWTIDAEKTAAAAMTSGAAGGGGARGRGGMGGGVGGGGGMSAGSAAVAGRPSAGAGGRGGFAGAGGRVGGAATATVIALDATTFTVGVGDTRTSYRLDGSPMTMDTVAGRVTSKAFWNGDRLTIENTTDGVNGQISTTTLWYLEGDSLVRELVRPGPDGQTTSRKTYYKRS